MRTQKSLVRDGDVINDDEIEQEYEAYRKARDEPPVDVNVPRFPWKKYDEEIYDDQGLIRSKVNKKK